jgi:hypothetical protein
MSVQPAEPHQPWGPAGGLLAACGATLTGVLRGVDPDVILGRALVSGLVVALVIGAARQTWRLSHPAVDEDD